MITTETKDNRIELRINEDLLNKIDDWRKKQGKFDFSRSDAVRYMIKSSTDDFKLSEQERISLYLSLLILKRDAQENEFLSKEKIDLALKAILYGHDWALKEIMSEMLVVPDKQTDVDFVYDVLNMFRVLTFSNRLLGDDAIPSEKISFKGFDNNDESELCSIALFILHDMDKYRELNKDRYELESAMTMKSVYEDMLKKYKKLYKGDPLTKEEIEQIIN